jgi:hypothetical protein
MGWIPMQAPANMLSNPPTQPDKASTNTLPNLPWPQQIQPPNQLPNQAAPPEQPPKQTTQPNQSSKQISQPQHLPLQKQPPKQPSQQQLTRQSLQERRENSFDITLMGTEPYMLFDVQINMANTSKSLNFIMVLVKGLYEYLKVWHNKGGCNFQFCVKGILICKSYLRISRKVSITTAVGWLLVWWSLERK